VKKIEIKLLLPDEITEIVTLDQICLGGIWNEDGYLKEIDSPNSYLVGLHLSEGKTSFSQARANLVLKTTIVGFACLWSIVNEAHITLLAVHPDYRRHSLGEFMLMSLLENAIARKLEWATLEVKVNNIGAISLYKKFGFKIVGTRPGYYQATGEDALILWRKGLQSSNFQLKLSDWQHKINDRLRQNNYKLN